MDEKSDNLKSKIENPESSKRLVAYVVLRQSMVTAHGELRDFLRKKLPDYMVPSAFVFLDALPLTSNGKLDRKRLSAPDHNTPELERSYVAPRTPAEELLAEIWGKVLNVEKVGIHGNFFDLGGHSLLATQVMARAREAFQVDLPLRALFEAPTVADLALRVERSIPHAGDFEELARSLAEVEALSDEEIERQLEKENP
ncbi:MAG: phosphopantetheine-binding protein [Candidatus Binatia bacterium]